MGYQETNRSTGARIVAAIRRMLPAVPRPRAPLAPQVRGRLTPSILAAFEARGWIAHRVGRAVYLHSADDADHLIFGVWPRRATPPAWADRLGVPSAALERRLERVTREQHWRRLERDERGRFVGLAPWWRWPTPALYRFMPSGPSVLELERLRAAAHNGRVRALRGLAWPFEPELVLRALDGDR